MIPNAPKHYEIHRNMSLGSNRVDWDCPLKKSRHHIVAQIFALIARAHRVLHRISCSYETIPNAPKYYKGPMGWIGCVRCKKFAPIHRILHRVSCGYEIIPNAPKHYETHQNMSLGSNGVDQVRLLGKITT